MWKKEFATDYVGFTKDGVEWLVENTDIKLVGKTQIVPSINLEILDNKIVACFLSLQVALSILCLCWKPGLMSFVVV